MDKNTSKYRGKTFKKFFIANIASLFLFIIFFLFIVFLGIARLPIADIGSIQKTLLMLIFLFSVLYYIGFSIFNYIQYSKPNKIISNLKINYKLLQDQKLELKLNYEKANTGLLSNKIKYADLLIMKDIIIIFGYNKNAGFFIFSQPIILAVTEIKSFKKYHIIHQIKFSDNKTIITFKNKKVVIENNLDPIFKEFL